MSKKPSKNKGMSSSFKASNIQTYAAGGHMYPGGGDLEKWMSRTNPTSNLYASPYYTNSLVGNRIPGYRAGFSTATGAGEYSKPVGGFGGLYVGQQYDPHTPSNTFLQHDYNLDDNKLNPVGNPNGPNIMFGGNIGWQGKAVKGGGVGGGGGVFPNAMPRIEAQAEYTPSTGIGGGVSFGSVLPLRKGNYRQGQIKGGINNASLLVEPYTGGTFNSTDASGWGWGVKADAEYRPKFLDKTGIPGHGYLSANLAMPFGAPRQESGDVETNNAAGAAGNVGIGLRPNFSIEGGYRMPLQKMDEIGLPKLPSMSSLVNLTRGNNEEDGVEQEPFIPDGGVGWGEAGKVNASPIHKRWQEEANDIFIPSGPASNAAPITYDPTTGESENTEAMNNYSKGGQVHINFANGGSFNNKGFQSLPANIQAKIRSNSFADGGQLTEFNAGGTHEESPIGGIPQGMAPDGKMNLVEEGETKLNTADYVFSDQIKIDKETATLYGLPKGDIGKTFADISKKVNRPNSRRDNDTIEQVAIQRDLENLMQAQEKQKEMQKDKDVAEFAAKYPDLAQNMPVEGQEQQMMQQQMGQDPMMDPNAMQQGMMEEQMNPPAGVPQQPMDPAMMAQMQQMGQMPMSYGGSLFNCGGKMYNAGGYMYGAGGNVWRGIGAGAYGVGEGLLDTLTFNLTDPITDKGAEKLMAMGNRSPEEIEKERMIRGFSNVGGAVLGAALTGGATTSAAVSQGIGGLTEGVTNIKGTDEKFDKIAGGIGQGASMIAGFMGPQGATQAAEGAAKGATQAAGVFKGNEAVNKLMNAKQNPFINQATQFAGSAMNSFANGGRMNYSMYQPLDHVTQYGGPLNMPTNDNPYVNFLAMGGPEGETPANPTNPTLAFNLNGIVANYTLEQALADPLVLEAFGAQSDEDGNMLKAPNLEEVKKAIATRFQEETLSNRQAVGLAQSEYDAALSAAANAEAPLPGETKEEYEKRMSDLEKANVNLDQKALIGEIKQTPMQAAMMALPAAYNIGRGLFEKAAVLDYNDYAQKANIDPYTMNIDPQIAEVRKAYAGANQAIKNASPGSGAYLGNMANVAASKQEAMNDLYTKKEMFDKEAKYKTDMANRDINNSNLALKMQLQTYNDAARAAKMKSLQEGLGQLADIATNDQGIDVQTQYLKAISPDYAENFKYSSIFDQIQAAAKAKKASKTSGK